MRYINLIQDIKLKFDFCSLVTAQKPTVVILLRFIEL